MGYSCAQAVPNVVLGFYTFPNGTKIRGDCHTCKRLVKKIPLF